MLRPVNVSVPVGKGIDESVDPHHKPPPLGERAENMRPEQAGSLRKRRGWASIGTVGSQGSAVLASDGTRALLLGPSSARVVTSEGMQTLSHGAPMPLTVRTQELRAIAGFGHTVQLARSGEYTAVIVSVLGDSTVRPGVASVSQLDYHCELAIYDATWRPVWGPHKVPQLKWLPRVEATDPIGGFAFFALGGTGAGPDTHTEGVLAGAYTLMRCRGYPSGPTPSPVIGDTVDPVKGDGELRWKIYDTAGETKSGGAYAAYISGGELAVIHTDGSAAATKRTASVGSVTRDHSVSVYASPDHVVLHHSGAQLVWSAAPSLIGALSSGVPAGPLDGVGAPSVVDTYYGSLHSDGYQVPELFRDPGGRIRLNERVVTVTGTGAGTPSVGPGGAPSLAHLHTPVVLGGREVYTRAQIASGRSGLVLGWGSHLDAYHLAAHPSLGGLRPQVDLSLLETRWGTEALSHMTFRTDPSGAPGPTYPCVTGQTAMAEDGRWLVPALPLTDQQNPRAERAADGPGPTIGLLNRSTYETTTAGAGYYNDEQRLVVVEVDPAVPTYSAEPHERSTLVAAGYPSMWADTVHPAVPRRPLLATYHHGDDGFVPPSSRQLAPFAIGIRDGSAETWGDVPGVVNYGRNFLVCGVLVFTDGSGVEYRSAPSVPLESVGVTTSGEFPEWVPQIAIQLEPDALAFLGDGRALDVELYVTERRESKGASTPDESTYTMVSRQPIQRDSAGWFVYDMMQDLSVEPGPGIPPASVVELWPNPPHVKPLYTLSGEAPNLPPPAAHVTAQVGGYAFLLAAEAPHEVWCSKPLVKGRSAEWNPALITYAPPSCGGVVSLGGAYDRLYLLCTRGVWEMPVIGGPNALGEGSFGAPMLVYRGQGCISHMGTVETPAGVYYLSKNGPRLIAGGGSVDVGRAVRTVLDWSTVTAATYDPSADEVTWWAPSGSVTYSQRLEAWSTSTLSTRAAAVIDAGLVRVDSLGGVRVENPRSVRDGADPILARYTSPWLSFGDVQGYKRVWEVMILGRLGSTFGIKEYYGAIRISLEYDYVEGPVDTYVFAHETLRTLSKGLQLSVKPKRQQVDSIRVTVDELTTETEDGQQGPIYDSNLDWTLTGVNIRLGAKAGLLKLQADAKQ